MDIIDNITQYFKNQDNKENNKEKISSPDGTCPICWGHQNYDGKIRDLLEDRQIDINNHKDSYMMIQDFMKHNIDGVKLKEGITTDCPTCSTELNENDK
ncbi:MAG: hypothetical protein ACQEWG_03095 [Bacteroidota bacterium]